MLVFRVPSFFGLGLEDGHGPTIWLLLYAMSSCPKLHILRLTGFATAAANSKHSDGRRLRGPFMAPLIYNLTQCHAI